MTETLEKLKDENDQLRQLVADADAVCRSRWTSIGLCDAISNNGRPYQSQWAAGLIVDVQKTHRPDSSIPAG